MGGKLEMRYGLETLKSSTPDNETIRPPKPPKSIQTVALTGEQIFKHLGL